MPSFTTEPTVPYDRDAIYSDNAPINPSFMHEAVRTLMRALPLDDPKEPPHLGHRRMNSALLALSALHPRDEIEVMLGVQAAVRLPCRRRLLAHRHEPSPPAWRQHTSHHRRSLSRPHVRHAAESP